MSKYITNVAVLIKGDRVPQGEIVELDPKVAANMGGDLSPADAVAAEAEPEPEPEKAIEDMTVPELKAKAESLGLSVSGTKADLIEKITLAQAGGAETEEEGEEELPAEDNED